MTVVIMGCGRVGARLAALLDADGHTVTVLDTDSYSFRRLSPEFGGAALLGKDMVQQAIKKGVPLERKERRLQEATLFS